MRPLDYLRMASKNIWRQKLRTALTVFAIMIGATSVTIMLALVTGAKNFFYKQFETSGALQQVVITQQQDLSYNEAQWGGNSSSDGVKLTDAMNDKIKAIPHVTATSRTLRPYSFDSITYNGKKLVANGAEANDANGVIKMEMAAGRTFNETDKENVVILPTSYANKFGFKGHYGDLVGKTVDIKTQKGYSGVGATLTEPAPITNTAGPGGGNNPMDMPATTFHAKVVGVVSSDDNTIQVPMSWARGMMLMRRYEWQQESCANRFGPCNNTGHWVLTTDDQQFTRQGYNTITAQVDQTSNTGSVADAAKKLGVGAVTADAFIQEQLKVFTIISYVLGGIGAIALLVAAIGVVNTMVMAMLERTREIGIMRATGARKITVRNLFTMEAATLGFWGGVFGVAAGYGLTRVANMEINKQLASSGVHSSNIIGLPLWLIIAVVGATTLIGTVAGLYPAFRAARLNPVDALRYE